MIKLRGNVKMIDKKKYKNNLLYIIKKEKEKKETFLKREGNMHIEEL